MSDLYKRLQKKSPTFVTNHQLTNIDMIRTLLTAILLMTNAVLWAAVRSDLSGTVMDAESRPVAFANIVLLSLPDSLFVQGTTSDEEGRFAMTTSNR